MKNLLFLSRGLEGLTGIEQDTTGKVNDFVAKKKNSTIV